MQSGFCAVASCSLGNQIHLVSTNSWSLSSKKHRTITCPGVSLQQKAITVEIVENTSEGGDNLKIKWPVLDDNITEDQKYAISKLPSKMSNRCKALMKQIICFSSDEKSLPLLLNSWVNIMKPRRADWLVVLKEMKRIDSPLLLDVMKYALAEESFEVNIRDYTKIIDTYGKQSRLHDAESAFLEMKTRGLACDQVTLTVLVNMYSKAGNLNRAKEVFEEIKLLGQLVDKRAYGAMIMAYIRAGMPELGEDLLHEMDSNEICAGREVYKALLRSYSTMGNADGAQRVFNAIQLAGIVPDARICALLINAYCIAGQTIDARSTLENMSSAGIHPNDKCVALMLKAYEKGNKLREAMSLLTQLERDGIAVGREAVEVVVLWLDRLGLVDEAAQLTCGSAVCQNMSSVPS